MDTASPPISATAQPTSKRFRRLIVTLLICVFIGLFVYWNFGLYTVQPIGALPQGATVVVWRGSGEPFLNSPDGTCLRVQQKVSLLCRLAAFGAAPTDRIILRLPYQHWAYLGSTGGLTFEN